MTTTRLGLLVPADGSKPATLREVRDQRSVARLIRARYAEAVLDLDGEVHRDADGGVDSKPFNARASRYIGAEDSYGLWGDVLFTGPNLSDVPEQVVEHFGATVLASRLGL